MLKELKCAKELKVTMELLNGVVCEKNGGRTESEISRHYWLQRFKKAAHDFPTGFYDQQKPKFI